MIVGFIFLLFMASPSAMNLLSIPQNPEFIPVELIESIFVGVENATKKIKIVGQYDPVIFF
jgi:hypothetical protein